MSGYADGTDGHAGSSTSKARAVADMTSGTSATRRAKTLRLVAQAQGHGVTWSEVGDLLHAHHGAASGTLSILHKQGRIARLSEVRSGSHVYVMPDHVDGRRTEPHGGRAKFDPAFVLGMVDDIQAIIICHDHDAQCRCAAIWSVTTKIREGLQP